MHLLNISLMESNKATGFAVLSTTHPRSTKLAELEFIAEHHHPGGIPQLDRPQFSPLYLIEKLANQSYLPRHWSPPN